jgi:RNA polymerase sigma factor for flagellar operon FliA
MKHDHAAFLDAVSPIRSDPCGAGAAAVSRAYSGDVASRVRRFLPLVKRLAWHVHGSGRQGSAAGIELEDLMQAGLVALTEAAQRHAGPGEDGFAAYAKLRVRGAMVDLVRRAVPLSRSAARDTEPAPRFDSLDEIYADSNPAFADDRPDALELLSDAQLRDSVIAAVAALPERLQLIVQLYFVEELNLAEIAQVLSVSIPRVHQLKAQALAQLRTALEGVAEVL